MAAPKYISARDGENNTVIYHAEDGTEYMHSGGTRAWRNNNPGNLIYAEKSGLKIGKAGKFAAFASYEDGKKALHYLLTHGYMSLKLDAVFKKYAPAVDDNDPEHYIKLVKKFSGLDATRTVGELSEEELKKFMAAIERVEGWKAGKVEQIPHAQQYVVKGVDGKPLAGVAYELTYLNKKGEQKKIKGTTDIHGCTQVAMTDVQTTVTLNLPRPDPGQSLKGTGAKPGAAAAAPKVKAAEIKAKPWYAWALSRAFAGEDLKYDDVAARVAPPPPAPPAKPPAAAPAPAKPPVPTPKPPVPPAPAPSTPAPAPSTAPVTASTPTAAPPAMAASAPAAATTSYEMPASAPTPPMVTATETSEAGPQTPAAYDPTGGAVPAPPAPPPPPPPPAPPPPVPPAPQATVKQGGAIQASGTQKKADNHIEGVVKDAGVFVSWEFDTSAGSGKVLNSLPYFIAVMEGDKWKPLVENQKVHLMRNNKIRQKVPFGKEVAIFLGNDAKSQYRKKPLYRVKAEEGLTDVVVKVAERRGTTYEQEKETPFGATTSGTKKTYKANLYGTTWMSFSHKFTAVEAQGVASGESAELQAALKLIYDGSPAAGSSSITLTVTKPNQKTMKIMWPRDAFQNCRDNIPSVSTLTNAKDEIIPRVHPQTYKAFLKAAFELDAEEMDINSGWRPMLGSILHRIGVGLDVGRIKVGGASKEFRRSATPAETSYNQLMAEKAALSKKKQRTPAEETRLNELKANEAAKAKAARDAIHANEHDSLRNFTAKLRANADVKQTFDPWEMDVDTSDNVAQTQNRLKTGNETLHRNHLHITVRDRELGF